MNFGLTEKHLNSITDALKLHPDSDQTDHPSTPYSFYTPHAPAASAPPTYPYNPRPRHNLPADNSSGPQHKQDTAACHQTAESSPKQPLNIKLMQVRIGPPHRHLNNPMKIRQ